MEKIKYEMIAAGKKLYDKDFIVATEGNISCRLDNNRIMITVSGVCKGELKHNDLVIIDTNGNPRESGKRPSTEFQMHLEAYRQRLDIKCVIHAHPPHVIALNLAGENFQQAYLPESAILLGAVPVAKYATPSTPEVAQSVLPHFQDSDTIILERHGSLTVGKSLKDALDKLEVLEHTAKIIWLAKQAGDPKPMEADDLKKLWQLRKGVYEKTFPVQKFKRDS